MTCDELRAVAPDLALDELTGAARADALEHLASCDACRALVADLALVADELLLVAPEIEPPAGFEARVVARIGARPPRRWRMVAAAAVAAAVLAGGVGFLAGRARDEARRLPVAAALRASDGRTTGSVLLAGGPDRMTCVFEDERFGGDYDVEVVLADGSVADVGSVTASDVPWSWTVALPVAAEDVRGVRVLSPGGVVRASAAVG